jgi:hypothetical protein
MDVEAQGLYAYDKTTRKRWFNTFGELPSRHEKSVIPFPLSLFILSFRSGDYQGRRFPCAR